MSTPDRGPDWNALAEKFDHWLPYIQPVAEQLYTAAAPTAHMRILDVAAGTGQPALTFAERLPGAEIIGVDAADGMLQVARRKARDGGHHRLSFQTMPAEALTFADATFDLAVCRFGAMLFDDPEKGLGEIFRVLKPGGTLVLSVWAETHRMSTFQLTSEALAPFIAADEEPPFAKAGCLGGPGVLANMLQALGFSHTEVSEHSLRYDFADFAAYWQLVEDSHMLAEQLEKLSEADLVGVKRTMGALAERYMTGGRLILPNDYLLGRCRR